MLRLSAALKRGVPPGRIQIDDPILSCFCDGEFRRKMRESNVDPDQLLDTYLDVLDRCVRDRPAGMIAGIHICRGNVKVRNVPSHVASEGLYLPLLLLYSPMALPLPRVRMNSSQRSCLRDAVSTASTYITSFPSINAAGSLTKNHAVGI